MAVLPESVSGPLMDKYPHVPLQLDGKPVTRKTWVCYQEGVRSLPQVDRFIAGLEEKAFL